MTTATVRHPAVAGRFYPDDADDLREEVRAYLSQTCRRKNQIALSAASFRTRAICIPATWPVLSSPD